MVSWLVKWGAKKVAKKGTKKVSETITSVKGKYNVGSADKIKKKSNVKKLHSTMEEFLGKTESDKLRKDISKKKNKRVLNWLKDF